MHPARLFALSYLGVSLLLIGYVAVLVPPFGPVLLVVLLGALIGGAASTYGVVRYEDNPMITEYDQQTYTLIGSSLLVAVVIAFQIGMELG